MNITIENVKGGLVELPRFADEWAVGGVGDSFPVVNPQGLWYGIPEPQKRGGLETMSCATFGTLAGIEILRTYIVNSLFENACQQGIGNCLIHPDPLSYPPFLSAGVLDYSERYTSTLAGTTRVGNSPHKVAETIRKDGVVEESVLPFNESVRTWEEFYDVEEARRRRPLGRRWLREWTFEHQWCGVSREELREALKVSPVGVAVFAWAKDENGIYVDAGNKVNHWGLLIGMTDEYYVVLDTYKPFIKKLDKNYRFGFAKIYRLGQRKMGFWGKLWAEVWTKLEVWTGGVDR